MGDSKTSQDEVNGQTNAMSPAPATYGIPNESPGAQPMNTSAPAPAVTAAPTTGAPPYPYPYPAPGNPTQGQAQYPMASPPGPGQYPDPQPNQPLLTQPQSYYGPAPPSPVAARPPAYPAYQSKQDVPPPSPGFAPAGQAPPVVVVNAAATVGHVPATIRCPHCQAQVTTDVHYEADGTTWLMCLIIFGTGCAFTILLAIGFLLWFVCFVPFCVKECKAAIHTCPNCKREIARKRPKYLS